MVIPISVDHTTKLEIEVSKLVPSMKNHTFNHEQTYENFVLEKEHIEVLKRKFSNRHKSTKWYSISNWGYGFSVYRG